MKEKEGEEKEEEGEKEGEWQSHALSYCWNILILRTVNFLGNDIVTNVWWPEHGRARF